MIGGRENKAFVYDTSRGFARLIKNNFSDRFSIDSCNVRRRFSEYDLSKYGVAFVMIDQYEELIDFLKIKKRIDKVLVTAKDIEVQKQLLDLEDVYVIDINKIKREALNDIINYLILTEQTGNGSPKN